MIGKEYNSPRDVEWTLYEYEQAMLVGDAELARGIRDANPEIPAARFDQIDGWIGWTALLL